MTSNKRFTPDRAMLLCVAVTVALYCRTLRYDLVLDDVPLILMNDTLSSWHNWTKAFTEHIFANYGNDVLGIHYRPVYMLWLMLNRQVFGMTFPWWHLASILLHVGITVLVFQLALKMVREPWTAALAAFLFALLPAHVESVAYVAASTDLLVTLFLLVSFLLYLRFRESGRRVAYGCAVAAAALAMLSKETAVMFPLALLAYEMIPQNSESESRPRRAMRTLPFFGVVAAYVAIRYLVLGPHVAGGSGFGLLFALTRIPLVVLVYIKNVFWPLHLGLFYPSDRILHWTISRTIAVVAITAGTVAAWRALRLRPGMKVLMLWTAIFFLPVLGAVFSFDAENWVHDRHLYLASVPLCIVIAGLLTSPNLRKWGLALSLGVLGFWLVVTSKNIPRFSDELALYESAIEASPGSQWAHTFYALALSTYGHKEEALAEFQRNTLMFPSGLAFQRYGEELAGDGRTRDAAAEFEKGLRLEQRPTVTRARLLYRMAVIETGCSQPAEAEEHIREALKIQPDALNYHTVLAEALRGEGRGAEATKEMQLEVEAQQHHLQDRSKRTN